MKRYDLRITDLDILFYIAHSGSKDIVDIGMSKANVSKSVNHLRKENLVTLSEDQEDRRCVHIMITEDAHSIMRELDCIKKEWLTLCTIILPRMISRLCFKQ
ncbi:MarR family winged helix-turn-helix transcriptional regulator [Lachnospiraceae bacterium OttesenSCG-928-D06]|nr:MarR family winged helix-turn-helix transcriptional regulator [Lachnospiraceae bacterium OttesenSCG-928-D06]